MIQDDDKPIDRRRFFRAGLRELFKPLASAVRPLEQVAHQIGKLDPPPPVRLPQAPSRPWIRPPGALPEAEFLNACSRCGECVKVCPAQCIKIDPTAREGDWAPYIDVDLMPCVLCDGLLCMNNCPSGALVPTLLADIDMGTARWHEPLCLRTQGDDCTVCIDHCPVGSAAIELREGKVAVNAEGCTGCGVCQHDCPTNPKSIIVIPKSVRKA